MNRLTHLPALCARVPAPVAFRAVLAVLAAALGTLAIAVTVPVAHASAAGPAPASPAVEDTVPSAGGAAVVAPRNALGTASQTATAPGAPENLSAAWRSGEVSLSWDAPAGDGGSPITGYEYRYRAGSAAFPDAWSSAGLDSEVTVDGLSNGVAHTLEVRAVNAAGVGSGSSVKVMPLAPKEGDIRVGIGTDDAGVPEVLVNDNWGKVCDDYITHREARVGCRQLGFSGGQLIKTAEEIYTSNRYPLEPGAPWFTMDNVRCAGGEGRLFDCEHISEANCFRVETVSIMCDTTGLGPPRNMTFIPSGAGGTLVWNAPARDGGAPDIRYDYRSRRAGRNFTDWTDAGRNLMASVAGLSQGSTHIFEVRAVNSAGMEAASVVNGVITDFTLVAWDGTGSQALHDGTTVMLGDYHADTFTIMADTTPHPNVGSMQMTLTGSLSHTVTKNDPPWRMFDSGHILPLGDYQLNATAYAEDDRGGATLDTLTIAFAVDATAPDAPENLSAHWANNQVTLSWQAPASDGGQDITGYQYRSKAGSGAFTAWSDVSGDLAAIIPNVADNAAYTYQVRAVNAIGFGTEASLTTPAAPSIPRDLTVSSNNGTATLSWAALARNGGATSPGYEYRHRELDGDFGDWTDAGSNLTAAVTGLADATGYVFEVRAVNVGGAGPPASASTATIIGFTLVADDDDAEPLNLKNGAIVMLDNYGTDRFGIRADVFDEYAIGSMALTLAGRLSHSQRENLTPWSLFGDQQGDLNTRVLNVGTYRLRATAYSEDDQAGDELGMRMVDFTVVEDMAEIPEAPQNLLAHFADGNLTFSWDAPADNGGSIITGYEYQYKAGDAEFTAWSAAPTDGSQAIANVTSGAAHTFAVRAVNAKGSGYAASLTTPVAPGEPRELSVAASSGQATLTWTPPAHNGGGTVTGYQRRHRVAGGGFNAWTNAGADLLNVTASGLTNGTTYEFQVRAVNSVGEGATASASALVSMTSVVTGFTLVDGDDNADLLTLTDGGMVVLADHATNGFAIRVEVSDDDAVGRMELTLHGPEQTHNQTEGKAPWSLYGDQGVGDLNGRSLTPGSYRLSAVVFGPSDQGGAELGTWEIAFKVVADMPDAPQNLAVHWVDGGLNLSWQAPANSAIAAVTGYQHRHQAGSGAFTDWSEASTNRTATIANVASAAAYTLEARAVNAEGSGDAASLTTPVVPGRPRNLSAAPGSGQATLSWTAPALNGGANVARYEHRHRASDGGFSAWTSVAAAFAATVSGLTNGTEYLFEVRAVNAAGGGPAASASAQVSMARIITGFTLVDDDNNANLLTLADSATVVLAIYATDSFAIRVEVSDNGAVGRMELELTGPQTHRQTEYLVPWSLYGDNGVGDLTGRSLTVGTYGVSATVYAGRGEDSAVLDTQSITFTVVAEE